jgi:Large polyvalent protein associated domain 23
MTDKPAGFQAYLPPGAWPYWPLTPPTGATTPDGGPWPSGSAPMAAVANSGLLGSLGATSGGLLGSLAWPLADTATAPPAAIGGPVSQRLPTTPPLFLAAQPLMAWGQDQRSSTEAGYDPETPYLPEPANSSDNARSRDGVGTATPSAPQEPPRKPSPPFYGPGDVLMPPPEPAAPEPPKDFRSWLRDALSDENTRYYLGPHLFEALRKLHALTQLLPGSGMVQSTQDSSRAGDEAQAGNYGKAASHVGIGTLNAALDWLPPAKLALIGGTMAKTFPWKKLPTAMEMEAAGRSADDIWRSTGLERDAAGNWTFEIPDKGYYVGLNSQKPEVHVAPLYEHYVHPGMREAYPALSNWRSELAIIPDGERGGATNFQERLVKLQARGLEGARNMGIHELQHLIGKREKHPPGGSPRDFINQGMSEQQALDHYWRLVGEVVGRNAQRRLHLSDHDRNLWSPRATEDIPRNRQINLFDDDWQ